MEAVLLFAVFSMIMGTSVCWSRQQRPSITVGGHTAYGQSDSQSLIAEEGVDRRIEFIERDSMKPWGPWNTDEARACLSGTTAMQSGCCDGISGGHLIVSREAVEVRVFDWHFSVRARKGIYTPFHQTGAVVNSLSIQLPAMKLVPVDSWLNRRIGDTRYQPINNVELTGYTAEFESQWAGKHFFRLDTVRNRLLPFVRDRSWRVEWTGDTLLVAKLQRLVPAKELEPFANDALRLADLLTEAAESYSQQLERLVENSAV